MKVFHAKDSRFREVILCERQFFFYFDTKHLQHVFLWRSKR